MSTTSQLRLLLTLCAALALFLVACDDSPDAAPDDQDPADDPVEEDAEDPADEDGDEADGEDVGDATGDLELAEEGSILVGSDIAFEPFEFIEDGETKGFDIDLFTEIAERLDLEVEFVNTPFDGIVTALAGGQFDALISAMTITEERAETIAFSDPYFAASQALAVTGDADITGTGDLVEGTAVGVQAGTTGLEYANENFADQGTEIREFPTSEAAFSALEGDQIDAVFIDLPVVSERAEGSGGAVELAEEVDTGELYGIGVPQESENLLAAINEQLADIIDDGTYETIYGEWFAGDAPEQFQ